MRIASVSASGRGETDRFLADLAATLEREGKRTVGVVKDLGHQSAFENGCDMKVRVLPDGPAIAITQALGPGSDACRLDPAGIAEAVILVTKRGVRDADVFILNKFGPEEAEGRGFRAAIAEAIENDVPVLVGLGAGANTHKGFAAFTGDMAETLPADLGAVLTWVSG
ncbi:DUF2478 domain-containing protein [Aliiroseovarius sp. F20344]|uniref:DUF2478 domain-containing protein n=1 Tax=Aliiroseovarius sp. F20344 TaxID=2926414 RepID=UPI001FF52197|nr:DUF2478 domain-containing protein [Aliiroseovarius sp. F20344]MCK0143924.1 DUF2478 domain-containing protein [Aliiroseovarius sp. F20344]